MLYRRAPGESGQDGESSASQAKQGGRGSEEPWSTLITLIRTYLVCVSAHSWSQGITLCTDTSPAAQGSNGDPDIKGKSHGKLSII